MRRLSGPRDYLKAIIPFYILGTAQSGGFMYLVLKMTEESGKQLPLDLERNLMIAATVGVPLLSGILAYMIPHFGNFLEKYMGRIYYEKIGH